MRELREDDRFRFVFVGSGGRRQELSSFAAAENIKAIELRPYADRADLAMSLASGDIGLVTQREVCWGTVVPSKVYGLLAAGRPYLFIGPANAMPARHHSRLPLRLAFPGGARSKPQLSCCRHLADHPEEIHAAGARGRQALLENFDLPLGVARIAEVLGASASGLAHAHAGHLGRTAISGTSVVRTISGVMLCTLFLLLVGSRSRSVFC